MALMALTGGRLFISTGLLGSPSAETYGHAWRQWWTGQALPNWATGPGSLLMVAKELPIIDPLPLCSPPQSVGYFLWKSDTTVGY